METLLLFHQSIHFRKIRRQRSFKRRPYFPRRSPPAKNATTSETSEQKGKTKFFNMPTPSKNAVHKEEW